LLSVDLGAAQLSNVRRRDGRTEVRVWNAERDPVSVRIGRVEADLRAGEIGTLGW
jgi:hypothetical protein